MAAGRPEFQRLLGRVAALVMVGGCVLFCFTGCAKKDTVETMAPTAVETVVEEPKEVKDTTVTNGFLDNTEETKQIQKVEQTDITISYDSSDTETDTQTVEGDEQAKFIIKNYLAPKFFDSVKDIGPSLTYNEEDKTLSAGDFIVSEICEIDEEGHLLAKEVNLGMDDEYTKPAVKYLQTGENEATAMYVGITHNPDTKSGLTFVFETKEDKLELIGLKGVFDENLADNIRFYEGGAFQGWAIKPDGEAVYEEGDEVLTRNDMTLYPIFKYEMNIADEKIDGMDVCIIGMDGNSYYLDGYDGTVTIINKGIGKNVDKEKVKEVQDMGKKEIKKEDTSKKDTKKEETKKKDNQKKEEAPKKDETPKDDGNKLNPQPEAPSVGPSTADIFGDAFMGTVDPNAPIPGGGHGSGYLE